MNNSIEYETITRCDGITYKRKKQKNNRFDCHLNIKFHKERIEQLKIIAYEKGKSYNQLLRDIIYEYIDENYKY
jgi:hypothetical protein